MEDLHLDPSTQISQDDVVHGEASASNVVPIDSPASISHAQPFASQNVSDSQTPYRQSPRAKSESPGRRFDKKNLLTETPAFQSASMRPTNAIGPSLFANQISRMTMGLPPDAPPAQEEPTVAAPAAEAQAPAEGAPPEVIPLSSASSSEGIPLEEDYRICVDHTNDKFEIMISRIDNLNKDHKSHENTILELMATVQRQHNEIQDLESRQRALQAKHGFNALTMSHFFTGCHRATG